MKNQYKREKFRFFLFGDPLPTSLQWIAHMQAKRRTRAIHYEVVIFLLFVILVYFVFPGPLNPRIQARNHW